MMLDFETSVILVISDHKGKSKSLSSDCIVTKPRKAEQTLKCFEFPSRNKETKFPQFDVSFMS